MDPQDSEKYEFLRKYVPKSAGSLFSQSTQSLMKRRMGVISSHRTIALSTLLLQPGIVPKKIAEYDMPSFILSPKVVEPPFSVSPQYIQQVTHFFMHLHQNPDIIVGELLSRKLKDSKLQMLTHCAIPCLFGYFSSWEHLNISMGFYVGMVTKCNPKDPYHQKVGRETLFPFFTAPCMFEFLESSFGPFFDRFLKDSRKMDTKLATVYAKDLTKLLVSNAYLIPQTHNVILKLMRTRWQMKNTSAFVHDRYIRSMAISWLDYMERASAKDRLLKVIDKIDGSEIVNGLCDAIPHFEVPSQYNVFEDPFNMFLVSSLEVYKLYKLVMSNSTMLQSYRILLQDVKGQEFVFWIKTYPKHEVPDQETYRKLIFPNWSVEIDKNPEHIRAWRAIEDLADKEEKEPYEMVQNMKVTPELKEFCLKTSVKKLLDGADAFEKFILYNWHLSSTQKWLDISNAHKQFIIAPVISKLIEGFGNHNFLVLFASCAHLIHSTENQQFLYLMILEREIPRMFKNSRDEIDIMEQRWVDLIKKRTETMDDLKVNVSHSTAAVFFKATEKIGGLGDETLPFQFTSLMSALELLHQLPESESNLLTNIRLAIVLSNVSKKLVTLFMTLNTLAMGIENFRMLCNEANHRYWINFQKVMLELMMEDDMLIATFFQLQVLFMQVK